MNSFERYLIEQGFKCYNNTGEGYKTISSIDNVANKYVKRGCPEIHYGLGEKGFSPYLISPEPLMLKEYSYGTELVLIGGAIMKRIESDHSNEELLELIRSNYKGLDKSKYLD